MKRLLVIIFALCFCGAGIIRADDNVRALQARLKTDGFYFGNLNGEYDNETAAAVSRYQIRNGLAITGQLDAATAKSLGVGEMRSGSAVPNRAQTRQRLRKPDQQFLENLATARPQPPTASRPTEPRTIRGIKPPAVLQPDAEGTNLVLSRERLRDYVAAFVLAGLDPHVGAELEFFADRVNYYDDGAVSRDKITRDLQRYDQRWPERRFSLAGQLEVHPEPDSRIRVTFPLRFDLRNGAKHASGTLLKTLLLEVTGDDLQIVSVNERKAH